MEEGFQQAAARPLSADERLFFAFAVDIRGVRITDAARLAGVNRTTIHRWVEQYRAQLDAIKDGQADEPYPRELIHWLQTSGVILARGFPHLDGGAIAPPAKSSARSELALLVELVELGREALAVLKRLEAKGSEPKVPVKQRPAPPIDSDDRDD